MTQAREKGGNAGFLQQKVLRSIGVSAEFERFNTENVPSAISQCSVSQQCRLRLVASSIFMAEIGQFRTETI